MSKEQAYKMVQDALNLCTVEKSHHSAVVVVVNEKENTVRVYGLNITEDDVPALLLEAASEVCGNHMEELKEQDIAMKATPYNNGKIKIGNEVYLNKLVNPPYVERDDDMLELQSYLIQDPRILNKEYWFKRIYIAFLLFVLTILLMAH
jgi:hypothetical protein